MGGVYVVTGGNRGIGLGICQGLSALGHSVVLVSRSVAKGEDALGRLPGPGVGRVLQGDVGSLEGAVALSQSLLALEAPIEGVIHNAGIWPTALNLNVDGLEASFVVNHLAPLLINHRIRDRLRADGARVVQVSAGLYVKGKYDPEATPMGGDFSQIRTYANTKLANLLVTLELAKRWGDDLPIHAVHPGVIRTGLGEMSGPLGWMMNLIKRLWQSPEYGAKAPIFVATEPDLANRTGVYFNEMEAAPLEGPALDEALRAVVWDQAMSYLEPHLP